MNDRLAEALGEPFCIGCGEPIPQCNGNWLAFFNTDVEETEFYHQPTFHGGEMGKWTRYPNSGYKAHIAWRKSNGEATTD
jgi:hypothetical protein